MTTAAPQVRAACYCRISSDPKDKREGVDRQRADTADICTINGWTPVGFYIDNDRSASNGGPRPEWDKVLGQIKAGEIDAVVVWNQDRGWREMAELESLRPIFTPRGVLLATTNIGVIDFRNPDDVFRVHVSTAQSEMEIAKMRVRMKRAARQRAERGIPKWSKAFGYRQGANGPEVDPVTGPLVAQAYRAILSGASLNDVARTFNTAGAYGLTGKPWSASTVSLFIRAPRNCALRAHNDQIVGPGNWPALVEEPLWREVQAKVNAPARKPGRKSVRMHLLTGVMDCANPSCDGGKLSGHRTGSGALAYVCKSCRGVSVRAENIEPFLHAHVCERLTQPDAIELLKAAQFDHQQAEAQRGELSTLYARLESIGVAVGEGDLTPKQARAATETVQAKIDDLTRAQQDSERLQVFDGIPLGSPEAAEKVAALTPDRYRAVLRVLLTAAIKPVGKGSHVFKPDRVVIGWQV
ncbi:MAG TPA: recombinase family protein [Mycobacterium sp.]|nr:recombinase family protein [Mycobacterium sp.]HTX93999.1 recombinase family protein [Mycobacterium sp.]